MKFFRKLWCFLFVCIVFTNGSVVHAENLAAGYTIEGIQKENQINKEVGYFYLKENPGDKDELKVKLINSSDKDKTLLVNIVDANTNVNGTIDYTGKLKNHSSLKTPLTSIVTATKKEIVVPKRSEVETVLTLTMPTEKVEGVIVGGVVVSEKKEEKESQSMAIKNTYSYTLAIVLTNDVQTPIKKNQSLELDTVEPLLFDGRKIVQASILNKNPYIFENVTVFGTIYDKKTGKKIIENKKENVEIAPYSAFPFQFDWKKEELKPGKYRFIGTATSGEKSWKFEREFEITGERAKNLNEETVFKVYIPQWLMVGEWLLVGLVSIGTIGLFMRKQRRRSNESNG